MNGFPARIAATTRALAVLTFAVLVAFAGPSSASLTLAAPAAAEPGIYGDPAKAAQYWGRQSYGNNCALMSVAGVVGQITGHMPDEEEIIELAKNTPSVTGDGKTVYADESGDGVITRDLPPLLVHYGIHATISNEDNGQAGLTALEHVLGAHHAVMIGVHAQTIWDGAPPGKDNHELVVTGIDTVNNVAHLNDSGTDDGRDLQVPIDRFLSAWSADEYEMTVTTETVH
jgi:hypothetical protein